MFYSFPGKSRWCSAACVACRASNEAYPKVPKDFEITEKAPTKTFPVIVKSSGTFG